MYLLWSCAFTMLQEASVIFSNAEEILSINTKLLGKLQAKGEPIAKLARVFLEVGPFFDIYLRYCYGYEPGLKVLQARRRQSLTLTLPLPLPLP